MFGGLLASAISKMDGDRGYNAWRWVFILEGIATILIGFMAFFALTDFPEEARWLTEEERKFVIAKAGTDEHPNEPITFRRIFDFLADGKPLAGGLMYFGGLCVSYHKKWLMLTSMLLQRLLSRCTVSKFHLNFPEDWTDETLSSILLLRSHDCQNPQVLSRRNPTPHRPSLRRGPRSLSYYGLLVRPPEHSVPFHSLRHYSQHHRPHRSNESS